VNFYTKGATAHRVACQSQGHEECRAGPLWRCSKCHRQFCMEDGGGDGYPSLCDDCWAGATQERRA
jgi:hypothetical protein